MQLTLVAIGKDEASLAEFDRTHVGAAELVLVANTPGEPLSTIANRHLARSRDVFGLCHVDTWFGPGSLEIFAQTALAGKICGVVGRGLDGVYHWCQGNPDRVSTLDGSSVLFAVRCGLRFDEATCNGFHCHVEDLCLQARKRGMDVLVPAADATHRGGNHGGKWNDDYFRYVAILRNKWKGVPFLTV